MPASARGPGVRRKLALLGLMVATTATCTPHETPELAPAPMVASPEIRIGLAVGVGQVEVGNDSGLAVLDADGATAGAIDPGGVWRVRRDGPRVTAGGTGHSSVTAQTAITFVPRGAGLFSLGGKWYRGRLSVVRDRTGLTAINTLRIEEYLPGVVGAELGRRDSAEAEALAAQAIVSRTFAIRNLGKRVAGGFDLLPSVVDQVYGGVASEYPLARGAVLRTAGQVVTWEGTPIDAFFFSTCGGRTARGTEVFAAADRPYLLGVRDADRDGQAFCRGSPRFRWREQWSGPELRGVLRQSLPAVMGTAVEQVGTVRAVQVTGRTGSDRVARVTVTLDRAAVDVEGPAVRQVLRPVGEALLRSAVFQLQETRENGGVTRLVAEGAGAGHGVGFCQWGAIGRARAGQDASTIVVAYFPGTTISRAY